MKFHGVGCGRILATSSLLLLAIVAYSQEERFGLGVIVGEPTGVSGKVWVSGRNAVDAGLAFSFRRKGHLHLHSDYLWHFSNAMPVAERFVPFAGIGGRLAVGRGDGSFGARFVIGMSWFPRNAPFEVFVELVPILDLAPATEMSGNAGIGVRYLF